MILTIQTVPEEITPRGYKDTKTVLDNLIYGAVLHVWFITIDLYVNIRYW